MNSQTLDEDSCQIQNTKNHHFGPYLDKGHLEVKNLEDESNNNLIVSFKQKNDVFIVENWKNYNANVSKPKLQIKYNKQSKNQCCITF